ncbi:MAG: MBL fold metallo-hydrolase [Pseudomonadota bacterium]
MADELRFTILGCSSSPGVPRIGNDWGNCDPQNPKNRRRRASMLVERISAKGTTTILIDAGPDLREQMLSSGVDWADAVLLTHPHADHIHGLDDLRAFFINRRQLVSVYCDASTSLRLHEAFGYCFETPEGSKYPPILTERRIAKGIAFDIEGEGGPIRVLPYAHQHGDIRSLGFRFENVAYSSDVSDLDEDALPHLNDLDVWIVDALQYRPHPNHFHLERSLEWIDRLKPKRAVLTHLHTPLDYDTVLAETPEHVEPAYDGMVFSVPIG